MYDVPSQECYIRPRPQSIMERELKPPHHGTGIIGQVPDVPVSSLLEEIEFRDAQRVAPALAALERLPADVLRVVQALLHSLPNRDDTVHYLKRLIIEARGLPSPVRAI